MIYTNSGKEAFLANGPFVPILGIGLLNHQTATPNFNHRHAYIAGYSQDTITLLDELKGG